MLHSVRHLYIPGTPEENRFRLVRHRSILLRGIIEDLPVRNRLLYKAAELAIHKVAYPRGSLSLFTTIEHGRQQLIGGDCLAFAALEEGAPIEELQKHYRLAVREVGEDLWIDGQGTLVNERLRSDTDDAYLKASVNTKGEVSFTDSTPAGTWVAANWEHARLKIPLQRTCADDMPH